MTFGMVTEHDLRTLALALEHGNKGAAARLGIKEQSVKNTITRVGKALGTYSKTQAAIRLGWLKVPTQYSAAQDLTPNGAGTYQRDGLGG